MKRVIFVFLLSIVFTPCTFALTKAEQLANSYVAQLKPLIPLALGKSTIQNIKAHADIIIFESEVNLEGIFGKGYEAYVKMTQSQKANILGAFFKELKKFQAKNLCSDKNLYELFQHNGMVEYNYYNTYNRKIGNVLVKQGDCQIE